MIFDQQIHDNGGNMHSRRFATWSVLRVVLSFGVRGTGKHGRAFCKRGVLGRKISYTQPSRNRASIQALGIPSSSSAERFSERIDLYPFCY